MVLDGNWSGLKEHCDKTIAEKIAGRLEEKKMIVRAKINGVSVDEMVRVMESVTVAEDDISEETVNITEGKNPKAKVRNKPECVFDNTNPKVTDDKDHFPINTEGRARNALARANQFTSVPKWYSGSLESLKKTVVRAVKKKYKNIEIDVKKDIE